MPTAFDDDGIVLAPSIARAGTWALTGAVVIGVVGWVLGTTVSVIVSTLAGATLLVAIPVTGWFAVQTLVPRAWTVRLGGGRVQGYAAGRPVDVDLRDVVAMRVGRAWGEPALVVRTDDGERALPLPVGVDPRVLASELDARRTRSPTARPFAR